MESSWKKATVITPHVATDDRFELSVQPGSLVYVLEVRKGWALIQHKNTFGYIAVKSLQTAPPPPAPLSLYDSSSTSNEDEDNFDWQSPESKKQASPPPPPPPPPTSNPLLPQAQLQYNSFIQSPRRASSPRHKEFREKAARISRATPLNTPPPLPVRRHSSHNTNHSPFKFKLSSPPPAIPSRRDSSSHQRKFTERVNRRESLVGLETKYKRMSLTFNAGQQQQQQEEEEEEQQELPMIVSPRKAKKNAIQLQHICHEIIETERAYCKDLDTIINYYLIPLRQQINLGHMSVSKKSGNESVEAIFNNIESIKTTNGLLLFSLSKHIEQASEDEDDEDEEDDDDDKDEAEDDDEDQDANEEQRKKINAKTTKSLVRLVGEAFEKVVQYFKMYSVYCVGYHQSLDCLSNLIQKHPMVDRFLNKCSTPLQQQRQQQQHQQQPSSNANQQPPPPLLNGHIHLSNLLIKPIQRICKYPLFFRDILKALPLQHVDRLYLEKITRLVEDMSLEVNNKVKSTDQSNAVILTSFRLQGTFPNLVQPQRRLLLEDNQIHIQHEKKLRRITKKVYTLFVFNDLLLFARPDKKSRSNNGLHKKYAWTMKNISIRGEKSVYDPRNGWPFYIMKSVNVAKNEDAAGSSGSGSTGGSEKKGNESYGSVSYHLKYGTTVQRYKLYAETEERRRAIVQCVEECKYGDVKCL